MEGYAKYKDTGVRAIGKIPADWETVKTAYAFSFGRGLSISRENMSEEGIPCVHYGEIHARYGFAVDPVKDKLPCIDESYLQSAPQALLKFGDYCFVGSSEDTDGSGNFTYLNSDVPAFAGSDTIILRAKREINHRFVAYMFDSLSFREQIRPEVYGVKVFHPTQSIIKRVIGIYPSLEEQSAIAVYLDRKTAKIDEILADLARQAEMLDTYKRELIAEAVTKGLDKSAAMKDSGAGWIGEVPTHWDVTPLRAFLKVVSVKNNADLPLLSVERERGVVDRETEGSENNHNRIPEDLSNYKVVRAGQFVMNKMKAWRGSYGVSNYDGIVSPAYYVFALNFPTPSFFNYAIRSTKYIGFFGRDSYGIRTDQWDFKIGAIKDIPLAVPPVEEQRAIVAYLNSKIPLVEGLIADIQVQREKLKQYRQIVIHDAITGKIKVTEG